MRVLSLIDEQTGSTARILPELGFNCFEFKAVVGNQPIDVIDALPGFEAGNLRPSSSGIPILFPFPNRIRAGVFRWKEREYVIPGSDKWGNAIHGFCFDRPWRVIAEGRNYATAQFQLSVDAPDRLACWPADFLLEVDYELLHNRLRANFRITNVSDRTLPWGLGTHPYFRVPLLPDSRIEDCTVEVPADGYWELENCLPTGNLLGIDEARDLRTGAYVNGLQLDDVLTGIRCSGPQFDTVLMDERAGLQVTQTCPPIFRELVAFTPPNRSAICLEPYTCVTDAMNLHGRGVNTGLRTLSVGSEFHTWIDIAVAPILA